MAKHNNKNKQNSNVLEPLKSNPDFILEMHPTKMARFIPNLIRDMLQNRINISEYAESLYNQECCTAILTYLEAEAYNAFADMVYLESWLQQYNDVVNKQSNQNLIPFQIGQMQQQPSTGNPLLDQQLMQNQPVPNPTPLYPYWNEGYNVIQDVSVQMNVLYQTCKTKYTNASTKYWVYQHFYTAFYNFYTTGNPRFLVFSVSGNQQYAKYIQPADYNATEYIINQLNSDYNKMRRQLKSDQRQNKGGNRKHESRSSSSQNQGDAGSGDR